MPQNGHVDFILSVNHRAHADVHEWPPARRPSNQKPSKIRDHTPPSLFAVSMHTAAWGNINVRSPLSLSSNIFFTTYLHTCPLVSNNPGNDTFHTFDATIRLNNSMRTNRSPGFAIGKPSGRLAGRISGIMNIELTQRRSTTSPDY